jgi:hypothetical protein
MMHPALHDFGAEIVNHNEHRTDVYKDETISRKELLTRLAIL